MDTIKPTLFRIVAFFTSIGFIISGIFPSGSPKSTDYQVCKNVILMIGDGMGFNSIKMAEQYLDCHFDSFDRFDLKGEAKTASATYRGTDSAAGATALATGVRVSINTVGVYPTDIDAQKSIPMNLSELAVQLGKSAGIVTTARVYDATPAAFSAHVSDRESQDEILRQQITSDLTLLWGENDPERNIKSTCSYYNSNFKIIWDKAQMDQLSDCSTQSLGLFSDGFWDPEFDPNAPTLAEMTAKAADLLGSNPKGFFLMVEAGQIDKCGEYQDKQGMSVAMSEFNKAIHTALDYAEDHGDTAVIVTADHETGGIIRIGGEYVYTSGLHSFANVPLYVYGCNNFMESGEKVENHEIGRRIGCILGEPDFPLTVKISDRSESAGQLYRSLNALYKRKVRQ